MRRALTLFTAFALLAGACSGDDDADTSSDATTDRTDDDTTTDVAPLDIPEVAFRTIVSADGDAMVIVSDDDTTDITVELLDPADYPDFLAGAEQSEGTAIYDLGPDGSTFDEPVRFFRRVDIANVGLDLDPLDVPLLLTYTTDDAGQPVLAGEPSILRTGNEVWVGASFDHFSEAITVNTQKTLSTNELFGQLIKSVRVKQDGPAVEPMFRGVAPQGTPGLPTGSAMPITFLDGDGPVTAPTFASALDGEVAYGGELDLSMRAPDGTFTLPSSLDVDTIDALDTGGITADIGTVQDLLLRTAYAEVQPDEPAIGAGVVPTAVVEFEDLDNPLGEPVTTEVDVGVLVGDDASIEQVAKAIGALINSDMLPPDPDAPLVQPIFASPFLMNVGVADGTTDSDLEPRIVLDPDAPVGAPFGDLFIVSTQPVGTDSFPVTGVGQLSAIADGAATSVKIDRYGDWNLAMVYAPDGLDASASLEITTEGGIDFLHIDGQRSDRPTTFLSSQSGGPPTGFPVDAAEGQIFSDELFADGFESGDVSAWSLDG